MKHHAKKPSRPRPATIICTTCTCANGLDEASCWNCGKHLDDENATRSSLLQRQREPLRYDGLHHLDSRDKDPLQ